jgi:hypothetical protein
MHTTDAILRTPPGGRIPLGGRTPREAPAARVPGESQVEIVVPVRNEERGLEPAVRRLRAFLDDSFPFAVRITIADNGSTDGTWAQALELAAEFPLVRAVHIERPGRGGALRTIWTGSDADIYAYMDVDLSTDLNALLPLVAPLLSGHSDVASGTRLARGARVIRGPKREIISRCYNLLLHASLGTRFSDAQCGFKAIRADAARALLPLITDTGWFFDTELLVLAERAGLRIHEVPVDWIDDADSRVNVMATALADLRGIVRLGTGLARGTISVPALRSADLRSPGDGPGHGMDLSTGSSMGLRTGRSTGPHGRRLASQLTRFVLVGVASTVAYLLLYLLLRRPARAGCERPQPAAHRDGQHRRQPAGHLRHPGPHERRPPPGARPDHVRHRPRAHVGRAGRPARQRPPGGPRRRAHRARGGEPHGHAGALRPLPQLGLPPPRFQPGHVPFRR